MLSRPLYKQVQELIARDELESAIVHLREALKDSPRVDEVLHQSGRLQQIKTQARLGHISTNEFNLELGKIRSALLELARNAAEGVAVPSDASPRGGSIRWALLAIPILILLYLGNHYLNSPEEPSSPSPSTVDRLPSAADPSAGDGDGRKPAPASSSEISAGNKPVSGRSGPDPEKKRVEKVSDLPSVYLDVSQKRQVAWYRSGERSVVAMRQAVQDRMQSEALTVTGTLFRPAFLEKIGTRIDDADPVTLRELGLPGQVNCVCQIVQDTTVSVSEMEGIPVFTVRGSVELILYNLKTGEKQIIDMGEDIQGAGVSAAAAFSSFKEKILKSGRIQKLDVSACK